MKHIILCMLTLSCRVGASAQPNGDLLRRLDGIRKDLARYDTLSPFEDFEAIETLAVGIIQASMSVLSDPQLTRALVEQHISMGPLQYLPSADDRVWLFSLEENTGGSFRSRLTFGRFLLPNGRLVITQDLASLNNVQGSRTSISIGGFDAMHRIDDSTYFVSSNVQGCSACLTLEAWRLVLSADGPRFFRFHSFDGWRDDVERFSYDSARRRFNYSCIERMDNSAMMPLPVTWSRGAYDYLNGDFVETEACTFRLAERPFSPKR